MVFYLNIIYFCNHKSKIINVLKESSMHSIISKGLGFKRKSYHSVNSLNVCTRNKFDFKIFNRRQVNTKSSSDSTAYNIMRLNYQHLHNILFHKRR